MAGSLAELTLAGGISQLRCPVTGRPVIGAGEGFDSDARHSPHLRFFVDWIGTAWAVDPADLREPDARKQEELIEILSSEEAYGSQNGMIDACVKALPASAVVFEILDPPAGAHQGDVCYACFDLADLGATEPVLLKEILPVDTDL